MAMQDETHTAFFSRTYEEATGLLVEARDYLATEEHADRARLGLGDRLRLTCEASRLTSRLTNIMAWLLARKAVFAGELTRAEAVRPPYQFERNETLADGDPTAYKNLSENLSELMDRSHRLYIRVARLDEIARRTAHQGPPWGR
jgi:regulator of CtrA degradation